MDRYGQFIHAAWLGKIDDSTDLYGQYKAELDDIYATRQDRDRENGVKLVTRVTSMTRMTSMADGQTAPKKSQAQGSST